MSNKETADLIIETLNDVDEGKKVVISSGWDTHKRKLVNIMLSDGRDFAQAYLDLLAKQEQLLREKKTAHALEAAVCMYTHFTGEPPYVGDEGLVLAIKEMSAALAKARDHRAEQEQLLGIKAIAETIYDKSKFNRMSPISIEDFDRLEWLLLAEAKGE